MLRRSPEPDEVESLLSDPQNLHEIAGLVGQFESEEAYEKFKAEWEAAKSPAIASDDLHPPAARSYRRSFLGKTVTRLRSLATGLGWRP
jgi:hypothetical protein